MAEPRSGLTGAGEAAASIGAEPSFAELFAALPVAVLAVDPEGCVMHANAACELLLNTSERSMLGHPLGEVLRFPDDVAAWPDGQGVAVFDVELVTQRGQRLRVDYAQAPIADRPGWRVLTLSDASPNRRRVHGDRPAGARAAIGAAAMLAHEIKNPLSGIRGAAQLLGGTNAEQAGLTKLITSEVDRIAALIDRMQDFTDTRPPLIAAENIYPLLDHARRVAAAGFARDVMIEERFDPSLPPVLIDRDRFLQVLLNLLKNAAEAVTGLDAPRITLATAYRHGMSVRPAPDRPKLPLPIEILVIDNGAGAPADIAEHLFEPFVSGKPEGKGLGLPLVEKLMRDMGGIVQYAREGDPEATVFRLLLPRGEG